MRTMLIGYDLTRKGINSYLNLINEIHLFPHYWHHLDSTWMVKTNLNAVQVRDLLLAHMHANDRLLVIDVTGRNWACYLLQSAISWLHRYM